MAAKKKKQAPEPQKFEDEIRFWLMLQPPEPEDGELQVAPEIKLVYATRNPYSVRALIRQGKFGADLGRALLGLIQEPSAYASPAADHTFRLLHGNQLYWALFSVARGGIQKLALLGFQRSGLVTEQSKETMWALLSIGERLCRELLDQEIQFAKEEGDEN
jgi:hypothetical protein